MNDETAGGMHWSFWTIGAVALIWNVMGIMNYMMQMQMSPDALAAMTETQRAIIEGRPPWVTGAFAIAVFAGALGCVLLLLRKSAAYYLFMLSLVGVIVQMLPYFGMVESKVTLGDFSIFEIVMYLLMPLAVAALLVWYAKHAESRGWIS